jgi:hypothetical protein
MVRAEALLGTGETAVADVAGLPKQDGDRDSGE